MLALVLLLQADALRNTREASSYEVTFESEQSVGLGDPLRRKGTLRRWKSGVLIVDYEGSGQERVQAVRAGVLHKCEAHPLSYASTPCDACGKPRAPTDVPRVWVRGAFDDWIPADESNHSAAAAGFLDPDEVLRVLEDSLNLAKKSPDGFTIEARNEEAAGMARRLAPHQNPAAENAVLRLTATLERDRLSRLKLDGRFHGNEGVLTLKGEAQFARFGEVERPSHMGDPKKPVRFSAAIQKALDEAPEWRK
jgi:hypothetical protein